MPNPTTRPAAVVQRSQFLDTKSVAELLSVSPKTIRSWVRDQLLPAIKTRPGHGGRLRFRIEDVQAFIDRSSVEHD